jgi:hypothetical protein
MTSFGDPIHGMFSTNVGQAVRIVMVALIGVGVLMFFNIEILGSAIVGGSNDWRGVLVRFHEDSLGDDYFESFRSNPFEVGQPVRTFNGIGNFVISLPEMQTNVAVVSGLLNLRLMRPGGNSRFPHKPSNMAL